MSAENKTIFSLLVIILLLLTACGSTDQTAVERRKLKYNNYGETVKVIPDDRDPVEKVLDILDLKPSDLVRPLYQEAGYHLIGRLPLVDHVAESPFYLHHWADSTSGKLQQVASESLAETFSLVIAILNGGVTYATPHLNAVAAEGGLSAAYTVLCKEYGVAPVPEVLNAMDNTGFSAMFDKMLGRLLITTFEAARLVEKAFASLSNADRTYLLSRPERYFFPTDNHFNFLTAPTHVPEKILMITRKIDFVSLYIAALTLSEGVDRFKDHFQLLAAAAEPSLFFSDGRKRSGTVLTIPSPIGDIVIMGQDDNVSTGEGALWIDLGGNDRYTGHVSVGSASSGNVALMIDIDGDDVYDRGHGRYAQGFGCLSVGMLIDMAGDDKYRAGNMAQGCGIYGVGLLLDLKGRDFYQMGLMGQGFGLFGTGLLLDADGKDRYVVNGMGQGTGSTLGFGGLLDLKGNDKYLSDRKKIRGRLVPDEWSHVQGAGLSIRSPDWTTRFSIYGGIGFLSDGSGNDFYFASDGNCMGSSYFMSIGALVDHNGSDKYISENGHGIGFAVHLSNGVLIDRAGNDHYFGRIYTGGVGSDRSVAVLADYSGNDIYGPDENYAAVLIGKESKLESASLSEVDQKKAVQEKMVELSFGSAIKPKAIGMLIDYNGDDQYYANPTGKMESIGGVVPPLEPQNWSNAILLDLSGKDYYYKQGRKDNHYYKYMDHSLCYDTEYKEGKPVGKLPLPEHHRRIEFSEPLQSLLKASPNYNQLKDLMNQDLFVRYTATDVITQKEVSAVSDLISILTLSSDNELNRDILEILNVNIVSGKLKPGLIRQLEPLLKAQDPFVRIFAARKLGYWRVKPARPALVQAAIDKNDRVRTSILWAIGHIAEAEVPETLISAASTDPSVKCRRAAVAALSEIAGRSIEWQKSGTFLIKEVFLKSLDDPDEAIRSLAAKGLRYFGNQQDVKSVLRERLGDESVYVKRAAANSLTLNEDKAAIPHLIETLQYPSIDTFKHYDREIVKDLAFYCGVDFSEEDRYAFSTWNRWWSENGSQVNLKLNLEIMHQIGMAFKAFGEERGLAIFEKLISENPDNIVVRRRYSRFCYEWITFRLLTRERVDAGILKRCLRLQKKQTELEPGKADHWGQLAYFHVRLSEFEESVSAMEKALQIQPENQDFQTAIKQYKILLERNLGRIRQKTS